MNASDSLLADVGECFVSWLVPECSYLLLSGGCYKMSAVFTCLTSGLCRESRVIRGAVRSCPPVDLHTWLKEGYTVGSFMEGVLKSYG